MADTTPSLALPLIAGGQAQKHVTHNEALALLDALVQLAVIDKDLAAPPASPAEGDRYLVAPDPSGAWAGWAGRIARYQDGAWLPLMPRSGWLAFVADEAEIYVFVGGAWVPLRSTVTALQSLTRLGVGTLADAQNPFSAKLNKALWTALTVPEGGTGDLRYTLNKQAAGNVLSLLLQTGFAARAEIGLVGGDNLSLRVSPDGGTWLNVFTVERTTGAATFDRGTLREEITVVTATGPWTKPDWARTVTVHLMGAGGGGGSGRRGASGTVRSGGGGGGAGALNSETYAAGELPATLTVEIGDGGAAGAARTVNDTNGAAGGLGAQTRLVAAGSAILFAPGGGGGGAGGTTAASGGSAGSQQSIEPVSAGGASSSTGGAGGGSGHAIKGASGGGAGGGLTTGNAASGGGNSGLAHLVGSGRAAQSAAGGPAGAGGADGNPKAWTRGAGSGGGGGGSGDAAGTAPGGSGGAGGVPGGGGGGGGGSTNGAASGAGGVGGRGEAWIIARG